MKPIKPIKQKKKRAAKPGLGSAISLSAIGPLLMLFIPWMVYQDGAGVVWLAIGCFLSTLIVWQIYSYRLMRFSLLQKHELTLPGFFSERYGEKGVLPRFFFGTVLFLFFAFASITILHGIASYASFALHIEPVVTFIALPALSFMFFILLDVRGSRITNRWLAILVLAALILLNVAVLRLLKGEGVLRNIFHSWDSGSVSRYVNAAYMNGEPISLSGYVSQLSYGLLILGSPLILQRFQQAENGKVVHSSRRWAIIFSLLALFSSIFVGGMLRAVFYPVSAATSRDIYRLLVDEVTGRGIVFYTTCILFVVAAALVFFELFHACLVQAMQIVWRDFYRPLQMVYQKKKKKKKESKKTELWLFLAISFIVELLVGLIAYSVEDGVYPVFCETLIIVSCGLAPVVLLSLYDVRMNMAGTVAGFLSGALFAGLWDLGRFFPVNDVRESLQSLSGIHSVLPAMVFGLISAFAVSRLTKKPAVSVKESFEQVKYRYVTSDEE